MTDGFVKIVSDADTGEILGVLGLLSRIGWGDRWRRLFADLYPGYGSSLRGLVIGAKWAFLDGATVGAGFA